MKLIVKGEKKQKGRIKKKLDKDEGEA